jgi:hypothetical protein
VKPRAHASHQSGHSNVDKTNHPIIQSMNQSSNSNSLTFLESIVLKLGSISAQAIKSKHIRVLTGTTAHRIERNLFHHLLREVDVSQQLTLRDMKYLEEKYFLVKDKCMNFTLFKQDFLLLGRETLKSQHDAEAMETFNKRMSVILGSRGNTNQEGSLADLASSTDLPEKVLQPTDDIEG